MIIHYLQNACIIHNLLYVDHQFDELKKQSHPHIETSITHINTIYHGESIQLKTPQLSIYYIDWEHVTIHSTILLASTQYYLHLLHTKLAQIWINRRFKSPPLLAYIHCAILHENGWSKLVFPLCCTTQSSLVISIIDCANLMHNYSHNWQLSCPFPHL